MGVFHGSTVEIRTSVKDYTHHDPPQDSVPAPPALNKRPQRDSAPKAAWGDFYRLLPLEAPSQGTASLCSAEVSPAHFNSFLPHILCGKFLLPGGPQKNLGTVYYAKCISAVLHCYTWVHTG